MTRRQLEFEIKEVENTIKGKEKRGESAKFERELVESWRKYLAELP